MAQAKELEISVVVPVHNEEDNIFSLVTEIKDALKDKYKFEIVYVDDGSTDKTYSKLQEAMEKFPELRVIRHKKSCGQSQAVATGVRYAKAPVIATLDGDGQNDPADIPNMYAVHQAEDNPEKLMIAGHRHKRKDVTSKRYTSKIANAIRKRLLKDDTPDTGCGCKLFPREAFMDMPRFDNMHRFLPALMIRGGGRVKSVHVNHRFREKGVSKYGFWDRFRASAFDIIGVCWLMKRSSNPEVEIVTKTKK
ncbi:MAG: glycosyltransferase family 2 protein [Alphaproteobacteria bacterium]